MTIKPKFTIGELVYLKTDPEQSPKIVTHIIISCLGITYEISENGSSSNHYDIELTVEKNVMIY